MSICIYLNLNLEIYKVWKNRMTLRILVSLSPRGSVQAKVLAV